MRKKANSGRQAVSSGFLRIGDDFDSDLRVRLVAVDDQLSMMTETVELGVWPSASVVVEQLSDDRFSLLIAGESLHYFPDNPPEFASQGIGSRPRRWSRKRGRSASAAAPRVTSDASDQGSAMETDTAEEDARPRSAPRPDGGSDGHPPAPTADAATAPSESARPPTTAAPHRVDADAKREREAERAAKAERRAELRAERRVERAAARERREKGRATRRELRAYQSHQTRERIRAGKSAARTATLLGAKALERSKWRARLGLYWVMDELRQIDGWPFNRIPHVAPGKRREPGHVHSFHMTTAPAGIIREVCTCGKIRLASKPIQLEGPAYLRAARPADPATAETPPDV